MQHTPGGSTSSNWKAGENGGNETVYSKINIFILKGVREPHESSLVLPQPPEPPWGQVGLKQEGVKIWISAPS